MIMSEKHRCGVRSKDFYWGARLSTFWGMILIINDNMRNTGVVSEARRGEGFLGREQRAPHGTCSRGDVLFLFLKLDK